MFENCVYDGTGAVLCMYRGYPFQCSEAEAPGEWAQLQALLADGLIEIESYVAPPGPSAADVIAFDAATARIQRDALLDQSDWLVNRHRDQRDSGDDVTLTNEQYTGLLGYRQALRDITSQDGWPSTIQWPAAPIAFSEA